MQTKTERRATARHLVPALIVAGLLAGAPARSGASMITYTETVTATGSLGGVAFSNATLTLTYGGDTANVTSPSGGIFRNSVGTGTVSVGGRTGTLTPPVNASVEVFVTQGDMTAGIETYNRILTIQNATLASYDLRSSTMLLTGTAAGTLNSPFDTSIGSLVITSFAGAATFQATPSVVPEPASWVLLGLGAAGVAVARSRRAAA